MDRRKLLIGLGVLLLIVGSLLASLCPGGIFNRGPSATLSTPLGTVHVREETGPSAGVIVGYVFLGIGGLALITGIALKN
jgi:hypothetical protein